MSLKGIPVWRPGAVAGGVDTHSYCSGHMLMRVTGLYENRGEGGREGGKEGGGVNVPQNISASKPLSESETKTQQVEEDVEGKVCPAAEWLDSTQREGM